MTDVTMVTNVISNDAFVKLFITIVSTTFIFWITNVIKDKVRRIIALRKILGSFKISENCIFQFSTSTGSRFGKLISVDENRVTFKMEKSEMYIPTVKFAYDTWELVDRSIEDSIEGLDKDTVEI